MPKRPIAYRQQWDALVEEAAALAAASPAPGLPLDHPAVERYEAQVTVTAVSQELVAHGVWESTARDMDDVLLLAELVWTFFWGGGSFPELPADIDDRGQREVAVAYLVRGVFTASQAQAGTADGEKRNAAALRRLVPQAAGIVGGVPAGRAADLPRSREPRGSVVRIGDRI